MEKILVLLPVSNTGGIFDYSMRFCECLSMKLKNDYSLTFCHPSHKCFNGIKEIQNLEEIGVEVNQFEAYITDNQCYIMMNKGELTDYRYAFIMCSQSPKPAPLYLPIKHAVVAHDFIEKYVPEVFSEKDLFIKHANESAADYIIVTTKPTYDDAIAMDHLKKSKIVLAPILLKMEEYRDGGEAEGISEPYFLWSTNTTQHKNHRRAIDALEKYYLEGGSFSCVITGASTRLWKIGEESSNEYVNEIKNKLHSSNILCDKIRILGNLPKDSYSVVLKNARFVFHPGYGDNGNGTVFDAASVGVPSVVSDYEAMHYLSEYASIPLKFFNYMDSETICKALIEMESEYIFLKKELPSKEVLDSKCYKNMGEELSEVVKKIINSR